MDTITKDRMPKVILLGNGVNRAFGSKSWDGLLKAMATKDYDDKKIENCPMPLKAILVTGNTIDKSLKKYIDSHKDETYGKIEDKAQAEMLQKILSLGADHILTTNYSYELEIAAQKDRGTLLEKEITRLMKHTDGVKRAETKYLLHTYNEVRHGDKLNRIWHIHGEARKFGSIVLGHYYYGNLIFKFKEHFDKIKNKHELILEKGEEWKLKNWIDAFILGDVYILGARLDLSEFDLWWLINRKAQEKFKGKGKLYFYEPKEEEGVDARLELIKVFGKVENVDVTLPRGNKNDLQVFAERQEKYLEFYQKAIDDIEKKINSVSSKEVK